MPIAEFAKEKDNVRDMLAIVDEATGHDCATSARAMMWIADITTETKPLGVANWTVPEASGNYCGRGAGRFGTHSTNENLTPIYYKRLLFVAHFNAGVRAVDIRDPFHPKEVGYYIPAVTALTACAAGQPAPRARSPTFTDRQGQDVLPCFAGSASAWHQMLGGTRPTSCCGRQPS